MTAVSKSYMGSTGISVSNLERSLDFYTRIIGLKKIFEVKLPHMEEAIMAFEGRPETRIALMYHADGSNPGLKSRMVKVSFYVPNPTEVMEAIRNEGLKIIREAVPVPEMRNAIVGLAYDHDGYLVEIVKARET